MKLKPLEYFPQTSKRFQLDRINLSEDSAEIFAYNDQEKYIRIFVDYIAHFQIANESYKVSKFAEFTKNPKDYDLFMNGSFFQTFDEKYKNWLIEESDGIFEGRSDDFLTYIFLFGDSVIETACGLIPTCSWIDTSPLK